MPDAKKYETEIETEIIELTRQLVESIVHSDWETYTQLCAEDLTAYEPEANGHLVKGMAFHQHYFDMQNASPYANATTTLSSPSVRILGEDAAVIAYVRLTQRVGGDNKSTTSSTQETRVWQRIGGVWKHVHFHRT
jgi:calcium/calmodulin-dependent protein kinase (CaM kinase) II